MNIVAAVLLLGGTFFMLVASIGLLRLPDLYTRMHAITKAGTLGVGLALVGVAVAFGDLSVTTRALAVILFVLLTAPVSAHMIGRAGYLGGVAMWSGTLFDQWKGTFDDMPRETEETEANARERERASRKEPAAS
jgi:multicomponent Na+:H+ antiporter subunit G